MGFFEYEYIIIFHPFIDLWSMFVFHGPSAGFYLFTQTCHVRHHMCARAGQQQVMICLLDLLSTLFSLN